jgi:hypothetical protein
VDDASAANCRRLEHEPRHQPRPLQLEPALFAVSSRCRSGRDRARPEILKREFSTPTPNRRAAGRRVGDRSVEPRDQREVEPGRERRVGAEAGHLLLAERVREGELDSVARRQPSEPPRRWSRTGCSRAFMVSSAALNRGVVVDVVVVALRLEARFAPVREPRCAHEAAGAEPSQVSNEPRAIRPSIRGRSTALTRLMVPPGAHGEPERSPR